MKAPSAKLAAVWAKRLAQSGFDDLEGSDRDAPLSNRGKLHSAGGQGFRQNAAPKAADSAVGDVGEDMVALSLRVEHGSAWTTWALGVHRSLSRSSVRQRLARRIWGRWANGESMKAISRTPGFTFHQVRESIIETAEKEKRRCDQDRNHLQAIRQMPDQQLTALLRAALAVLSRRSGPRRFASMNQT